MTTLPALLSHALLALFLGSLIGVERQWHRRLGDLQTNALVCMGAALFVSACQQATGAYVDAIRMGGQIVTGVGFIGGGLLFRDGTRTRGINTAATLWCCAAIGLLCGLGRHLDALCATALLTLANTVLRAAAWSLNLRMGLADALTEQLVFDIECTTAQTAAVRTGLEQVLRGRHGELRAVTAARTPHGTTCLSATAAFESPDLRADIEAVLCAIDGWDVINISWHRL
jgi:putative Mg2+ transporter-C (MgtC) family protein